MMELSDVIDLTYLIIYLRQEQITNNMSISNPKYRIAELTEENLPAAAKLLADTFLHYNPVWSSYRPTDAEVLHFMTEKTREMIKAQNALIKRGVLSTYINVVYLDKNDKLVGVSTNYDLADYLTNTRSEVTLHHFNVLEKMGIQLQKSIIKEDIVLGKSIYGMFVSVAPEYMSEGAILNLFIDYCDHAYRHGFSWAYGRCSNLRTEAMMIKMGGERTGILQVEDGGQTYMLSFAKMPCRPFSQNKGALIKSKPRAKL